MTTDIYVPAIVTAAQSESLLAAALAYARLGFSVLPLKGKRPNLPTWTVHQKQAASPDLIHTWHQAGLLHNIGLVCGSASGNRVALDLDGAAGYPAFVALFPHLADTYTVATGGGVGKHIYWQVEDLPEPVKAMNTPLGNVEMCSQGRQIVAPPSLHPTTQQPYRVEKACDILQVKDLQAVVEWIDSFKKASPMPHSHWQPPRHLPAHRGDLNPRLLEELARHFTGLGYKAYGDWLHGRCVYPGNHKNGDRHPSFGFNTQTGYGYCFKCGTMLAKDLCTALGIRPDDYGGLIARQEYLPPRHSVVTLSDAPIDSPQSTEPESPALSVAAGSALPPHEPVAPALTTLTLPNWLQLYLEWAGRTGN
jgi:hypothetical protein